MVQHRRLRDNYNYDYDYVQTTAKMGILDEMDLMFENLRRWNTNTTKRMPERRVNFDEIELKFNLNLIF